MRQIRLMITTILILMVAESAHAVLIFTDFTAWSTAAGIFTTETFDNTIVDADSIILDNGIVSTAVPSLLTFGLNNVNVSTSGAYTGRVGLLANSHPPVIRWDLPSAINAWFADFGALNTNGLVARGNWDGTGDATLNIAATIGANGGYGIIGDAAFTSFEWRTNDSSEFFRVDNFSSASVAVPEPTTLALLGIGLVGIGLTRRRR